MAGRSGQDTLHDPHSTHVVHFYDGDEELIPAVVDYLSEGIARGDRPIVIATPGHVATIRRCLEREGIDTDVLIAVDAADALRGFMVDGRVDRARFSATVGRRIRQAAAGRGGVRAFGEMVALLWDEGNVTAAIELEEAWNDLLEDVSTAALYCAYPSASVDRPAHREALDDVCRLHTEVTRASVPAVDISRRFSDGLDSPRAARRFVAEVLQPFDLDGLLDDVTLAVSELVTNAVTHARSEVTVRLSLRDKTVRVAVEDSSTRPPTIKAPTSLDRSGRGLMLIDALAVRWGSEVTGTGKIVWAEFAQGGARA